MDGPSHSEQHTAPPTHLSFTTGILVGQGSVILVLILFIRYVIFEDGSKAVETAFPKKKPKLRRPSQLNRASSAPRPPTLPSQVLSKTQYDLSSHPAESMDWLNVLFGQVIANYRSSLLAHSGEDGARRVMESWLNPAQGVSWLDPIQVTSLALGSSYPIFSNARIRPSDASGRMRAETEIDYSDSVTLGISTSLLINFPRPRFAVLPISLGVTLVGLTGTVSMELLSTPSSTDPPCPHQSMQLALHPDFSLSIETTSLLGSRAKLHDLPKIEQLVSSRLRQALVDRVVWPKFFAVGLPALGVGVSKQTSSKKTGESSTTTTTTTTTASSSGPGVGAGRKSGDTLLGGDTVDSNIFTKTGTDRIEGKHDRPTDREQHSLGFGNLGEQFMKNVLPTPDGLDVHLTEQDGILRESTRQRMKPGMTRRQTNSLLSASSEEDLVDPSASVFTSSSKLGHSGQPAPTSRRRETGLGGGVKTMPGGSDWGPDGM